MPAIDPAPLFRRLIGGAFDTLPQRVRAIHEAPCVLRGQCDIRRGGGILSRLCGALAGMPPAGDRVPTVVSITRDGEGEIWRRDFGGRGFTSRLCECDGDLKERLGPTTFRFRLVADSEAIRWDVVGVRVLGIPLPLWAMSGILAREAIVEGRYCFDVSAALPLVGLVVHYRGLLDPP